jgi:hypothetical protein
LSKGRFFLAFYHVRYGNFSFILLLMIKGSIKGTKVWYLIKEIKKNISWLSTLSFPTFLNFLVWNESQFDLLFCLWVIFDDNYFCSNVCVKILLTWFSYVFCLFKVLCQFLRYHVMDVSWNLTSHQLLISFASGRRITSSGQRDLDQVAGRVAVSQWEVIAGSLRMQNTWEELWNLVILSWRRYEMGPLFNFMLSRSPSCFYCPIVKSTSWNHFI